jgi:hypothetical protein
MTKAFGERVFVCLFSKSSVGDFNRVDRNSLSLPLFPLGNFQSTMDPEMRETGYSDFAKLNTIEDLFPSCSFY